MLGCSVLRTCVHIAKPQLKTVDVHNKSACRGLLSSNTLNGVGTCYRYPIGFRSCVGRERQAALHPDAAAATHMRLQPLNLHNTLDCSHQHADVPTFTWLSSEPEACPYPAHIFHLSANTLLV